MLELLTQALLKVFEPLLEILRLLLPCLVQLLSRFLLQLHLALLQLLK